MTSPWLPKMRPFISGLAWHSASQRRPSSKPGRIHGIQPISSPKAFVINASPFFAAANAISASACM